MSAPTPAQDRSRDGILSWLLATSLLGVLFQISLGGVVRVTESGLGCPDWPLCNGRLIPAAEFHTLLEYSHRTLGALVGLVLAGATLRVWLRHRSDASLLTLVMGSTLLLAIVGGIGGAVVLSELDPAIRTAHLALAEIVLLLVMIALVSRVAPARVGQGSATHVLPAIAAGAALLALLSGSYAVWQGAGAVCPSWPLCGGALLPQSDLAWIHVVHRLLSLAALILALSAARKPLLLRAKEPLRATAAAGAVAAIVAQVLVGAANPWTDFHEWARALHLSLATISWGTLALLTVLSWPAAEEKARPRSAAHATPAGGG